MTGSVVRGAPEVIVVMGQRDGDCAETVRGREVFKQSWKISSSQGPRGQVFIPKLNVPVAWYG